MVAQIVRYYYVIVALLYSGVNATSAMYALYLLAYGLDKSDVLVVKAVYFGTMLVCIFPTAVLSDWLGRKSLLLSSCAFFASGMLTFAFGGGYWWFISGEIMLGLGQACANAACGSWFVDSVTHHSAKYEHFDKHFSLAWTIRHLTALVAGWVGGWLAARSMQYTWFFAASFFFVLFLFAFVLMHEPYLAKTPIVFREVWGELKKRTRTSYRCAVANGAIRYVVAAVFGLNLAITAVNLMWPPYFEMWVPAKEDLGLIWAGVAASQMLGAYLATSIVNGFACQRKALLLCLLLVAGGIISAAVFDFPKALAAFCIYMAARGAFGAIIDSFVHKSIEGNEHRAAEASFESLAYHAGGTVGLILWVAIPNDVSIPTVWTVSGIVLLGLVVLLWKNGSKKK